MHVGFDMRIMRGEQLRTVWWVRGLVITTALLALATGFCLFDQDHDGTAGHVTPPDLCLGMLAVLTIMPLVRPLAVGWAVSLPVAAPHAVTLHIPDPPPKPASLL
jgi:hypothetical protein